MRVPGPNYFAWWIQPARLAFLLLTAVHIAGTVGYVVIEGWDPWDAFYMTVISVTTVGYREVHPLSRTGQAFTVAVVTFGVATVLYTFSFLMARLVEGDLQARWIQRRHRRMLD